MPASEVETSLASRGARPGGSGEDRRARGMWPAGVLLGLAVVLLVVPGATGGPLAGAPLSFSGRIAFAGLVTAGVAAWLFRLRRLPAWTGLAILLLTAAKLGLAAFDAPPGWMARVYLEATPDRAEPFFWRFGEHDYRLDPAIAFEGAHFGLHFLNDIEYNSGVYDAARRDESLGWRVEWRGHATTTAGGPLAGSLSAAGDVVVEADGVELLRTTNPVDVSFAVPSGAGHPVRLAITYRKPSGLRPSIRLVWDEPATVHVASDEAAASARGAQQARSMATTAAVVAGLALVWGAIGLGLARGAAPRWGTSRLVAGVVVAGVAVVAIAALALAHRYAGQTYHMSEGNDPLVYEGHARDIMADGPLMLAGEPLGQAKPYFHYPFYPYVVAAMHWLIGEDPAAVMLGNGLMVAMLLPLFWVLGWHRLAPPAAAAALVVAGLAIGWHALPYTREVFTDNLFLPLVFVGLNLGVWAARSNRAVAWWLTGAAIALGAATRPSLLTSLPFLLVAVGLAGGRRDWRWSARAAILLIVGFASAVLPFTLRNYYVSGQLVMLVNSWVGLAIFLVPPGESYAFIYSGRALGLRESAAQAIGLLLEHPWRTIDLELRKVFFTFGFTNLARGEALQADLVALSVAGLVAVGRGLIDRPLLLVTGAFAASHLTAMVLAAPWTYGYKSILPIQFLLLFWAAFLTTRRRARTT